MRLSLIQNWDKLIQNWDKLKSSPIPPSPLFTGLPVWGTYPETYPRGPLKGESRVPLETRGTLSESQCR